MSKKSEKCKECLNKNCNKCESRSSCLCECNINKPVDILQKTLAIAGGAGIAFGGLALSILSGGIATPLLGSVLMGAGLSSTIKGIEKSYNHERIDVVDYISDVGFGAVTGVVTGGVGAAGEILAANVAKKLLVRGIAGGVAGVTSKAVDEVRVCVVNEKEWSNFGKQLDEYGKDKGTTSAWLLSAGAGILGATVGQLSSKISNEASSNITKTASKVIISGTTAGVTDAACQGINIALGNQENFDIKRTVSTATVSATTTAVFESASNGIFALNGGKENVIVNKTNNDIINNDLPEEIRESAKISYNDLDKIPPEELLKEHDKAAKYPKMKAKNFGKSNIHVLHGDKKGKIASDIGNKNGKRGEKRLIYNTKTDNGNLINELNGYTLDHYKNIEPINFQDCKIKNENLIIQNEILREQEQKILINHILNENIETKEENEDEEKKSK